MLSLILFGLDNEFSLEQVAKGQEWAGWVGGALGRQNGSWVGWEGGEKIRPT